MTETDTSNIKFCKIAKDISGIGMEAYNVNVSKCFYNVTCYSSSRLAKTPKKIRLSIFIRNGGNFWIGRIDNGDQVCFLIFSAKVGLSWVEALKYCEEQVPILRWLFLPIL